MATMDSLSNGPTKTLTPDGHSDELRRIFAEVLKKDVNSLDDAKSFFALGGDSLLAIRVFAECRNAGLPLTLDAILSPTPILNASQNERLLKENGLASPCLPEASGILLSYDALDASVKGRLSAIASNPAEDIESIFACSRMQRDILLSQQVRRKTYQCSFILELALNTSAIHAHQLATSWTMLVERHPILRTVFLEETHGEETHEQVVLKRISPQIIMETREDEVRKEDIPSLDVSQPQHRLTLFQRSPSKVLLRLDISHALIDGQSARILLHELLSLACGHPISSPALSLRYSEFVAFERQASDSQSSDYWSKYIQGAEPSNLPALDFINDSMGYMAINFRIPLDSTDVNRFCARHDVTMSSICQLAWGLVLRCLLRVDSVCFSYIVSGRDAPLKGIEASVGPFISTLVSRLKFDDASTVEEMLQTVISDLKDGFTHKYAERDSQDTSARKWGNTLLSFDHAIEDERAAESGIKVNIVDAINPTDYALCINIHAILDELIVNFKYWDPQMDDEYVQLATKLFKEAVKYVLSGEGKKISDSSLLAAEDVGQIKIWNSTTATAVQSCLHELVKKQGEERPHEIAVHAWDGHWTYHTLHEQAQRLAWHLSSLGVKSESNVGMCMDKSKWATVAILAILQAGGVVVPLGVQHPLARIKTIVDDASISIILVDQTQADRLNGVVTHLPVVGDPFLSSLSVPSTPVNSGVTPDNAAWIVYTSGSTGIPKGVVLEHNVLCTSVLAHIRTVGMGPDTRCVQYAAHTFDNCYHDTFSTLISGGCLCIISEADRVNNIAGALRAMEVNVGLLTSTVAQFLTPDTVPSMKQLLLTGEAVKPSILECWANHATVLNVYGPAECSISSYSPPLMNREEVDLLGYPLMGSYWVANPSNHHQLCPIGVAGELLIESPIMARGYLNDANKTADVFVTDPAWVAELGLTPGRRIYRTGDLVRQKSDGSFIYLGRRDTQIKIRGQRVEIGEIEYWVTKLFPQVRNAAVEVIAKDEESQKSLFVALDFLESSEFVQGISPTENDKDLHLLPATDRFREETHQLRARLFNAIPSYMIPSAFIPFVQLPLNLSGKLDRRRIRESLDSLGLEAIREYGDSSEARDEPRTDTERMLQILWASNLGVAVDSVGRGDNFFQLGGDSVTAMRVVADSRTHSISLAVADIFKYPRLCDLAEFLEVKENTESPEIQDSVAPFSLWTASDSSDGADELQVRLEECAAKCGIPVGHIEDIYPCTPLQEGMMSTTSLRPDTYVARRVFRLAPYIDLGRFKATWERLASCTAILRTRVILDKHATALQVIVRESIQWKISNSLSNYLAGDGAIPITYGQPLVRWGIVEEPNIGNKGDDIQRYFIWTGHHATYDDWSSQAMFSLAAKIYTTNELPPITPFSHFLRYLSSIDREETKAFWKNQLDGVQTTQFPSIPSPGYKVQVTSSTSLTITSSQPKVGDETVSTVLRAAWAFVVMQQLGLDEIVLAVTLSGRTAPVPGISEIIAPTITTVPVRIRIDRNMTVQEYLESLHKQITDMMAYEHTGLQNIGKMVPEARSSLDAGHLFHVLMPNESDAKPTQDFKGVEALDTEANGFDSYALNIECSASSDSSIIKVEARHDSSIISKVQVQRLLAQLSLVYSQLQSREPQLVRDISTITKGDITQLKAWNASRPETINKFIHDMVNVYCQNQPSAVAIAAWDGELTYGSLWSRAKLLSNHLVSLGVGPEIKVGICMDKSKWAPVAMLSILMAGGVVVPLGIQHPFSRIKTIVKDAGITIALVDGLQAERLANLVPNLIKIADYFSSMLEQGNCVVPSEATPKNAAWIIYTSGSTGTPKGVVLEHAALATSLQAHGERMGLNANTKGLQFSAYTFDMSIADTMGVLCHGGTVCIPSEDDRLNQLSVFVKAHDVNFAMLTATVAEMIAPDNVPSLKTLALIGEPVKPAVVERWLGKANIINGYGPAECSINASSNYIKTKDESLNIGYPLAGHLWVVDPANYHNLSPIGVPGEVLIEGPLLARGYLNDSEKTAAAFITNPRWSSRFGSNNCERRMYRTGDLARQNDNGSLTYLGRRDTQIKIRGQRVEVGEIEYWVTSLLPDAQGAAVDVISYKNADGDVEQTHLTVTVEFSPQSTHNFASKNESNTELRLLTVSKNLFENFMQLRKSLFEVLPSHMVPSVFLPLNHLPMNASGKLDRRAINIFLKNVPPQQLQSHLAVSNKCKVKPSTNSERALQKLWAAALNVAVDSIGANDHFLDIGGDSMTAMHVVAASHSLLTPLTVAEIFQHPKLSDLACVIDDKAKLTNGSLVVTETPLRFSLWSEFQKSPEKITNSLHHLTQVCGVTSDEIEDVYPCTPLQEGMMAITSQRPSAYVARWVFRLSLLVDTAKFQNAWDQVVEIVPILRTQILMDPNSSSLQVVLRQPIQWNKAQSLSDYVARDTEVPMAYGKPLGRWAIVEGEHDRYFVWTLHHSLYDGWSVQKIFSLVSKIYAGQEAPRPAPFSRFIRYLDQKDQDVTKAFWEKQLEGRKPSQFPTLPSRSYQPRVTRSTTRQIFGNHSQTTQSATTSIMLRAAWALIVAKYLGTDEATLAVTLSGRAVPVANVLAIVAPTVTTAPVRVIVDQDQSISSYLNVVQQQAIEMIPHEHTGLQNIRRLLPEIDDLDPGHLFVVQMANERFDLSETRIPGIEVEDNTLHEFDSYPLNIECTVFEKANTIEVEARFDDQIISESHAARLLAQLEHVYCQFQRQDVLFLRDVEVVTSEDLHLITNWNESMKDPLDACIHDLIKSQVEKRPEALAVCSWDGDLTYGQLWSYSMKLAHHLVALGIGPESKVGFCMDKSKWAPVSILAILQSGGAVVALGTQHPKARVETIVQDSGMTLIFADEEQAFRLADIVPHLITINMQLLNSLPVHNEPACTTVTHRNVAWVTYTSGSTGTPKGIVQDHRGVSTSMRGYANAYGMDHTTRLLQFSAYTFDVSIPETIGILAHGGCMCIPSESDRLNRLAEAIDTMKVDLAMLTSTVALLLDPEAVPSLKTLILAGEAVNPVVVEKWLPYIKKIYNAYGPGETSLTSSSEITQRNQYQNIGYPLYGRLWVCDTNDYHRLCPVGVVGELLIEGPLLARCYLNDPVKTEASFVMNPNWVSKLGLTSRRLFKSGDLVRQNEDGSLTYFGRRDTQIKLRGQRVEVNEIEYWVTQLLKDVRNAAVEVYSRNGSGEDQVALLVVVDFLEGSEIAQDAPQSPEPQLLPSSNKLRETFQTLRSSLYDVLPSYMVPFSIIPFSALPKNISRKLDRRAIKNLVGDLSAEQIQSYAPLPSGKQQPSTATEHQLQELWAKYLDIEFSSINATDNFFQLGGDSVIAMRMVTACQSLSINLKVADIFKHPRLCELGSVLDQKDVGSPEIKEDPAPFSLWEQSKLKNIQEFDTQLQYLADKCNISVDQIVDVYPCTPLQEGFMVISSQRPDAYVARQAFRLSSTIDIPRLQEAWDHLAAITPILRTRIVLDSNSTSLQVVVNEPTLWANATSLAEYMAADRQTLLTYGQRLLRCAIVKELDATYFVWTGHHSTYDGWSVQRMFSNLAQIYAGEEIPISAPFSRLIRYFGSVDSEETKSFWVKELEGAESSLFPPLPDPSYLPQVTKYTTRTMVRRQHSGSETTAIILRAAWAMVVSQHVGKDDVVFPITLSGRAAPVADIAEMVAPTITTVPIRVRIDRTKSIQEYLAALQKQAADMIPYEHIGLQNIRRLLPDGGHSLNLGHLFVVHIADEQRRTAAATSLGFESLEDSRLGFNSYGLTIECTSSGEEGSVVVEARFDEVVIKETKVRRILAQFDKVFQQLQVEDSQ